MNTKLIIFCALSLITIPAVAESDCNVAKLDLKIQELSEECCKVSKAADSLASNGKNKKFNESFEYSYSFVTGQIDRKIETLKKLNRNGKHNKYDGDIDRLNAYKKKLESHKESIRSDLARNCPGKGGQFAIKIGLNHAGGFSDLEKPDDLVGRVDHLEGWSGETVESMGVFESLEQAQVIQKQIENRDDFSFCRISKTKTAKGAIGPAVPVKIESLFGTDDFFADNSKEISPAAKDYLQSGVTALTSTTAPLKVKIFTCASMYRNCASDNSPTCHSLSLMRKYSDSALLGSSETPPELKAVLNHPDYIKSINSMKSSEYYKDTKEQRLWVALSMMRALEIESQFKEKMPKDRKVEFEITPTGHPNDPFNNSKLDPALSGTCGPLPKENSDSYYGSEDNSCEAKSFLIDMVKNRDNTQNEKFKEYYEKTFPDDEVKLGERNYAAHRYAKIEIETVPENKKPTIANVEKVDAWEVRCARMNNGCEKWSKGLPRIKLPKVTLPSIRLGGGGFYRKVGGGSSRGLGCYFD